MTTDLPPKDRFRLTELAQRLDKHVSTVIRWTQRGVRGVVLKSHLIGGQRYIDKVDFLAFLDAINGAHEVEPQRPEPAAMERLRRTDEELDRAGM